MDLHPADILIHIINIAVLFIILRAILFKPVNKFLAERSKKIADDLEAAKNAKDDAEKEKAKYEAILADATAEADRLLRAREEKASEEAEEIISDAKSKADALLTQSREKAAEEKKKSEAAMRDDIAVLAVDIASKVISRSLTLDDNKKIAEEFFENGKKV